MKPHLAITSALLINLAAGLLACDGAPDEPPDMQAPAPDAEPETRPDADPALDTGPDPGAEPCPEQSALHLPCAVEDTRCSYPLNECPCGDPHIHYVCRDGAFVEDGADSGCEYAAPQCNAPECAVGPAGACDGDLDCWFDDGVDEETEAPRFRRWACVDGALTDTGDTHVQRF